MNASMVSMNIIHIFVNHQIFPKLKIYSKAIVNKTSSFKYFKCGLKTMTTEYKGTKIWITEGFGYLNSE